MTHPIRTKETPAIPTRPAASRRSHPGLAAVTLATALALGAGAALTARAAEFVVPSDSFSTVQDAVDTASPGDVIRVLSGSYDSLFVFTSGLIIKADPDTAPVQLSDVLILAEGVTFEGFTVTDGITLIDCAGGTVSHNTVSAGSVGIVVLDSPAMAIDHNTVNAGIGILLSSSPDLHVEHNTIVAGAVGISLEYCDGARLQHNNATGTDVAGIEVFMSANGHIDFNSASGFHGIDVSDGSCGNVFSYNAASGAEFGLYSADTSSASCNTCVKNRAATAFPSLKFWGAR